MFSKKEKSIKSAIIIFISGLLYALSFAPTSLWFLSYLSLWLFLWCSKTAHSQHTFYKGFLFGLGAFGLGVSWVFVSIHEHGPAPIWLATSLTALFVIFLASLHALHLYIWARLFPPSSTYRYWFGWPLLWLCSEAVRSTLFGGFPWLLIGTAQIDTPLSVLASLGSVWYVSFCTVSIIGITFALFQKPRNPLYYCLLTGLFLNIGLLQKTQWTFPQGSPISVALIQGNIPQAQRWDEAYVRSIIDQYFDLTRHHTAPHTQLVIWPESAIPIPLHSIHNELTELLQERPHMALITGTLVFGKTEHEYYNALVGLGLAKGTYFKEHLLPFGEFVPFERWLRGLIDFFNLPRSAYTSGLVDQPPLSTPFGALACAICYEIAFPFLVRERLQTPPDVLLTVSNDAWFGHSFGPHQHLEVARFRALETGRYVLRATNSGITALIDPKGNLVHSLGIAQRGVVSGKFWMMDGSTPWLQFGTWPLLLLLFLWVGLFLIIKGIAHFKGRSL